VEVTDEDDLGIVVEFGAFDNEGGGDDVPIFGKSSCNNSDNQQNNDGSGNAYVGM
jgi:hypothetical protein